MGDPCKSNKVHLPSLQQEAPAPASLSTQSQYRKHLKMRHNKTIDIMGTIIDSPPEAKDKDRAKRKRRVVKPEEDTTGKKKRRRRLKTDSTEISQYEEVVHSSSN